MNPQSRLARAYGHCELGHAKECPFCGSNVLALVDDAVGPLIPTRQWRVFCGSCGVKGPQAWTKDLAVAYWNGEFHHSFDGSFISGRPLADGAR